ncbi:DnaA N-terminal domain-containing protein [Thermogutta sp.]|uniref:DnaA N-terminal domain-containing protein n=1 Tax=Thermogutta sp. TaxID=1962930 RepID=UPI00322069D2
MLEPEPIFLEEEEEEEKKERARTKELDSTDEIARTLQENGVFPELEQGNTGEQAREAVPEEETPEPERLWQRALGELQLELTRATFETWLRGSRAIACEDGTFVIRVANTYARDWLESRLKPVVERVLTRVVGQPTTVRFIVNN